MEYANLPDWLRDMWAEALEESARGDIARLLICQDAFMELDDADGWKCGTDLVQFLQIASRIGSHFTGWRGEKILKRL